MKKKWQKQFFIGPRVSSDHRVAVYESFFFLRQGDPDLAV